MKSSFNNLEKILKKKCSGTPVYYLSNPGNWGDGLIRYGTLKFLKKIDLNFKELSFEELINLDLTKESKDQYTLLPKKPTVIYGGGGAWCELWNHSVDYVSKLQEKYHVIVLPSTYESTYTISDTIFFSRDKFESKQHMPQSIFCHDMAFYIGDDFSSTKKGEGKGYFFRTDKESENKITIPINNHDISKDGNHFSDISLFFESIDTFSTIYTDRLHVSIAAALLGKKVHLYPGTYFKNRAIYLSTLKDNFSNVVFHQNYEGLNNNTTKMTDIVSIIIPCYNQAQYLEETVQSAIDQTYSNIEIIIINDGSTDNTEEVASLLQKKYPTKIQVISQENTGLCIVRNNAIKQSRGTYILPLDSDDLIEKNMVSSCLNHMIDHNADIVYVQQQCFGVKNHLIKRPPFPKSNLLYQNISGPSGLYKREVWEKTGGYAENMKGGYEDWEFWIHAFKKGYKFQFLPAPLHLYRRHEVSMITKAIDQDVYLKSKIVINHSELYPIEHVKKSIQVISNSESLADLYFYCPIDFSLDQKDLTEALRLYLTSEKLQEKQFIDIPHSNQKIILYTLDIIKDHKHLQQLCVNEEGNFVIFYSSLRYKLPTLKNLNFAWDKDKGIIETKGSIFPFVFKSIRENDKLQLIAYQRLYKYNIEVFEPKTKQQSSICKQRIQNREKMIENREKTIHKIKKAKENLVRTQALFHPIKKYKAYNNLIKQIGKTKN